MMYQVKGTQVNQHLMGGIMCSWLGVRLFTLAIVPVSEDKVSFGVFDFVSNVVLAFPRDSLKRV